MYVTQIEVANFTKVFYKYGVVPDGLVKVWWNVMQKTDEKLKITDKKHTILDYLRF